MATDDPSKQLQRHGAVLLQDAFPKPSLLILKDAAERCFHAVETGKPVPDHYRLSVSSHSVILAALLDFGCDDAELTAPLSAPGIEGLVSELMGSDWICGMEQSWLRKKFAPGHKAPRGYHLQNWHQDGALGVRFPLEAGTAIPMTELMTCWIPLNACGEDSPGLEFVRGRQPALVHFSELGDSTLRQRFPAQDFWAPSLDFGDGLLFLKDVLHRTFAREEMRHSRLSIEYRIFRGDSGPVSISNPSQKGE